MVWKKMQAEQRNDVMRLLGLLAAASLLDWMLGTWAYITLVVLASVLFFHLRNLYRLHSWAENPGQGELPEAGGLWGDIFNSLYVVERETAISSDSLKLELSLFEEAADALPDAMIILGKDGLIERANPAATRDFGIRYPQDRGQAITNLVRSPAFRSYLAKTDYRKPLELDAPVNPERALSVLVIPFSSWQKLIIARDVSHIRNLENMRQTFIANISHELRSPLTVLSGYLETLKQMPDADEEPLKTALPHMVHHSERITSLIEDLLALSRLETKPLNDNDQPVAVPELIGHLHKARDVILKDRKLNVSFDVDDTLMIKGNDSEIQSVISNLFNNAVRYTEDGGNISVSWQRCHEGAVYSVQDSGIGIAHEHIARLTERFYRVDADRSRESGGTGLGLAIVKHVLERHQAVLEVESEPGKGSIFRAIFPLNRVMARRTSSLKK
ncbi:MAG: phosphate regulon sensor histidine kinase PhoR [Proteobacteria bacterium]|nr:phosphate regulon sensor histidine kinase PhoR [Pseudomonadota bacterium]